MLLRKTDYCHCKFRSPLATAFRAAEPQVSGTADENLLPSLAGLTLLVVEDEADAREMIALILEQCGGKIIAVDSVKQAFKALEQHQIDGIISDISLPLADGYQLMEQIRSSEGKQSRIPAIALTAYARPEDQQQALAAGFDLHLPKPIEPWQLVKSLLQLLQKKAE